MKLIRYISLPVVNVIVGIWRLCIPQKLLISIQKLRILVYSSWISGNFKDFGIKSIVYYPVNLLGGERITLGKNVVVGKNSILNAWYFHNGIEYNPEIIIGHDVLLGECTHISAINRIVIGDNVLMGRRVTIVDNSHGETNLENIILPPMKRKLVSKGPIVIHKNVWIGDKVTILGGVVIGENSIIGANSVVTQSIPANSVVGGIPARLLKTMK